MFIGQYLHSLEDKGRLAMPKKFRQDLGKQLVVSRGLDGCLFAFSLGKWQELTEKLKKSSLTKKDSRAFNRFLTYGAIEVEADSQGRILIPLFLREYASIKKEVVVAGALDRVEIWDKKRFDQYSKKIEKESEEIAERLEGSEV